MAHSAANQPLQILTYIRRNRQLTREQFYAHWETVHAPKVVGWAEKHGFLRYQQMHTSGFMVPVPSAASAPNAKVNATLSREPVEFDGIAVFLVPSLEQFTNAFADSYFVEVIEPDEQVLLDKEGPEGGIVASFMGRVVDVVANGKAVI